MLGEHRKAASTHIYTTNCSTLIGSHYEQGAPKDGAGMPFIFGHFNSIATLKRTKEKTKLSDLWSAVAGM